MRAIVLVGFMASGKSTVGRHLADRLGWQFIDFDEEIRSRWGRTPAEVIREDGEAAFREMEAALTEEMVEADEVVLAPGGGWVTRPDLAERLGEGTVCVWLRVSPETAVARSEGERDVERPLLDGPGGRLARARSLLAEREPLYAAADLAVDAEAGGPDEVAEKILRLLNGPKPENQISEV